jgi:subtilisin family serine protease
MRVLINIFLLIIVISLFTAIPAGTYRKLENANENHLVIYQTNQIDGNTYTNIDHTGQTVEDVSVSDIEFITTDQGTMPGILLPNDTDLGKQWALNQLNIFHLWQLEKQHQGVIVAILDTGIDKNHEDLIGQVIAEKNFTTSPTIGDVYGHGTKIAGIIAANINGIGIAGVAPDVRLLNVKIADDTGMCRASDLAQGIIWAVDMGADVINISIGIKEPYSKLESALNYAWNKGAIIIAAAGNNGDQYPVYPAAYSDVVSVAATREDNSLAPLSNYGEWIDLAAPGYKIYSTFPGNEYGYVTGTSFATGYISGIAALLFGLIDDDNYNGYLNDEITLVLRSSFSKANTMKIGGGTVDVKSILAHIAATN